MIRDMYMLVLSEPVAVWDRSGYYGKYGIRGRFLNETQLTVLSILGPSFPQEGSALTYNSFSINSFINLHNHPPGRYSSTHRILHS